MKNEIEKVVNELGGFGRYQLFVVSLAYLTAIFCSQHVVQDSFINYTPEHRCRVPQCDTENSVYEESFLNFTTPVNEDDEWVKCDYYEPILNSSSDDIVSRISTHGTLIWKLWHTKSPHSTKQISQDNSDNEQCLPESFSNTDTISCNAGWVYNDDLFHSTTTMEFDLTCDRAYITSLTTSSYNLGMLIGALSIGIVADKFGRKVGYLVSVGFTIAGSVIGAMSVSALMLVLARIPTGIGAVGLFECALILAVELTPLRFRSLVGLLINVAFALGEALVGVYAIFIRDWRALQLTIVLPSCVLILYYWLMPESLRWLVGRKKYSQAKQQIEKIASVNKVDPPALYFMTNENVDKISTKSDASNKEKKKSAFDLLRTPNMRRRTLSSYVIWISVNMVYYGVSQNAVNLNGNIFVNFIAAMLIEIPAYIIVSAVYDGLGHKGTLGISLLLAGVMCLLCGVINSEAQTAIVSLSLIGKFGAASAFACIYVYAMEVFPTEYRSIGVGSCSMCARFGGIIAPLIASLGKENPQLPLLILGITSSLSALCVLFLPETVGNPLPQTLEQSEAFGSDQSMFYFRGLWCMKTSRGSLDQDEQEQQQNKSNSTSVSSH